MTQQFNREHLDNGPWYKQPWPWFLMAGPFLAMVGCAITITLAFQNYGNQAVQDGGVKRGLVVERPAASTNGDSSKNTQSDK